MPATSEKHSSRQGTARAWRRRWPFRIIFALAAVALLFVLSFRWRQRQDQNIALAIVVTSTFLLLLLAWVFFSRLRWQTRLLGFGTVLGAVVLSAALFRFRGVTGDLVPVVEWRWRHHRLSAISTQAQADSPSLAAERTQFTNDYPQFLGPHRDTTLAAPRLGHDWTAKPPELLWRLQVGPGLSGFAVAGRRAITQEQRGEQEAVVCYDLLVGTPLWSYAYDAHFDSPIAGEGPRATPTITGQRVHTLGATGVLSCLDCETGKPIWSKDIVRDNDTQTNEWGSSCSPLVVDDLVVVSAGGRNNRSLVAYKAATGEFAWGGGTDGAGYSSPRLASLAGIPQILIFNSGGVSAHATTDGKILWKYHWPGGHPHVSTPVVLPEDRVLVSSGYGFGSAMLQITKDSGGAFSATQLWKSNRLKAKFTNLVCRDGFIYGLDDGTMVCLDAKTGELKWKEGRYGHGQEMLVADLLLVTAESGEVVLLAPNSQALRELTRFPALQGKTWNPPALAGQYLLVRNESQAACYRLPVAGL